MAQNMPGTYRVRLRKGDFEVEVESHDKNYTDSKLNELFEKEDGIEDGGNTSTFNNAQQSEVRSESKSVGQDLESGVDVVANVVAIAKAINDSDEFDNIVKYVLDPKNTLGRIMLCLHFASKEKGPDGLTTGEIETITNQLNVKLLKSNAGAKIKSNQRFFSADSVRKKGAKPRYKLTRQGIKAFEALLSGEAI